MPNSEQDYLRLLLNQYWFAPPVALWRSVELRVLATEDFARPILDLGCGDGLIAQVLFTGEAPIEAGFDPWWEQVHKAPRSDIYRHIKQAAGNALPYPQAAFATVFSNSVLEHIPELAPVLHEVARVLKPGGHFIATVPSHAFRRLLAGYREHVAIGDLQGAEAYACSVDQRLEHYRYPTPEQWADILAQAGLHLLRYRYYIPPEVEALWDRANATYGINQEGFPFYRWLVSPRLRKLGYQAIIRRIVTRALYRRWQWAYTVDVPPGSVGGGLLFVGEKV